MKKIIALALPLLFLSLISLNLATATAEPWKGTRINILDGLDVTISSSEYFHVMHGWALGPWSGISGQDRSWFMGPSFWFELETDPATFTGRLRRLNVNDREIDTMVRMWWIQFRPGDLTPGVYSFTGRWYIDYIVSSEITITLTVT